MAERCGRRRRTGRRSISRILPPGMEIILALRPAALLAHPEGEKVVRRARASSENRPSKKSPHDGISLAEIEQLVDRLANDLRLWHGPITARARSQRR